MSTRARTLLALDYGLRNIGVAVGNEATGTAQPAGIIGARNGTPDWQALEKKIREWQPDLVLIGLPLNMDASASDMSQRTEKFARQVEGRFGVAVALVDERLSSREARQRAREAGHAGDYAAVPVDDLAAEVILNTWLNDQGSRRRSSSTS